ncbi:MAG: sugar phosphate isomerase/epimerase family protein [Candidatus Bathyarchaeia archaeon]|nr:sugar phosphate isomerase/epimerase [Candidatus Bathyarchaeota archaeon]
MVEADLSSPKVGLSTLYKLSESFISALKDVLNYNVEVIEVVDDGAHSLNKQRVSKLLEIAKCYDVSFSVHAPFADINIASPSPILLRAMIKRLLKSLKYAAALGSRVWVLHPGVETGISSFYPEKSWIKNRETIRLLWRTIGDYGVTLAIENLPEPYPFIMKNVEHFKRFYEEVDVDVGLALDIGHANISKQVDLFIRTFRGRIVHIHAHDNFGKVDEHLGIGYGSVNWEMTIRLLKEINYSNFIIVESISHVRESLTNLSKLIHLEM